VEVEIAHAEREFEYEEKMHEARVAIERDACLAPAGEEWRMMLRREEALDRSIDRKIKLLLSLRKSAERSPAAELRSDAPADCRPPPAGSADLPTCRPADCRPAVVYCPLRVPTRGDMIILQALSTKNKLGGNYK